jgi:hypothetical protein
MNTRLLVFGVLLATAPACARFATDGATPEGAVLVLNAAHQEKDLEAVVAARDFKAEARLMLSKLQPILVKNDELILKTAETLETTFRTKLKVTGFEDQSEVETSFVGREEVTPDLMRVEEKRVKKDGSSVTRWVVVARGASGWRVAKL